MSFVRRHTNIPLPKVYSFFKSAWWRPLNGDTCKDLNYGQLKKVSQQVQEHVQSLRSIPQFTSPTRATWVMKKLNAPIPDEAFEARKVFPDNAKAVLSHGDLSPFNILVDDDGNVVAILDWENFGFWPEWWEYQRAMYYRSYLSGDWDKIVESMLSGYEKETQAYEIMQSYAGGLYQSLQQYDVFLI
ncbi:hypothetical protein BT69DRAFT_1325571 [Atractiella rhizophila]|nr:hypothetical protein BT69DRAFT_1325571 [Atractiella rhizophila]